MAKNFYKGFTSSVASLEVWRMDTNQRKMREKDISFALRLIGSQEQAYSPLLQRKWNTSEIKILWQANCTTEATDECTEACVDVASGREVSFEWTTLPDDFKCVTDKFSINEEKLLQQGQNPAIVFANEMRKALSNIEKKFADNILIEAISMAGTNNYIDQSLVCYDSANKRTLFPKGTVSNASNQVSETDKFARTLAYLDKVAQQNAFSDGWYMFDAGKLMGPRMLASRFQKDGVTDLEGFSNNIFGGRYFAATRNIKAIEDKFGLKEALVMVDPNAFSVVNTHYYKSINGIGELPSELMQSDMLHDMERRFQNIYELTQNGKSPRIDYSMPMPTLTQRYNVINSDGSISDNVTVIPMYADVSHQYECIGPALRKHNVSITLRYQIITRPLACDNEYADSTGILVFAEDCACVPNGECSEDPCDTVPAYGLNLELNGTSLSIPSLGTLLPYESGGGYVPTSQISSINLQVKKGVPGLSSTVATYSLAELATATQLELENGSYFVTAVVTLNVNGATCTQTLSAPTFDITCPPANGICDSIDVVFSCKSGGTILVLNATDINTGADYTANMTGFVLELSDANGNIFNAAANDAVAVAAGIDIASSLLQTVVIQVSGSINFTFPNGKTCKKMLDAKDVTRCDITAPTAKVDCPDPNAKTAEANPAVEAPPVKGKK